ncbi:MAG: hypothetical protein Q7U30_14570, partial [Methylicorpusculum sp.]|nr:hypothetical protein [Methylicorpusculum sp.]
SPLDIFQKDILNYEAQLKSWCEGQVVFVVHFDDLWTKNEELNKFLGFYLHLPERSARAEKPLPIRYNKMLFDDLKQLELEVRTKVK